MKKLLAVIFSLAILSGCAAGKGTEVTETSGTSETSTASVTSEKAETTTVTTAETTTEVTTEAIDTSGIDYIKEALQADWDGGEHNDNKWKGSKSLRSSVFFADLNADGVDELFTACHYRAGSTGCVSVYDVSDGAKLLCEMESRTYPSAGALYTDSNGVLHYIIRSEYWNSSDIFHTAYFDLILITN